MSNTFTIGVRRAETGDADAITAVHDAAWRYAYEGMIPAKELARIIARRGPRWWDRAIRRGTAILVIEVGGTMCGYATFGPNRARNLVQKGEVYEIYLLPEYQGVGLGTRLFLPPAASSAASASIPWLSGRSPTTSRPAASTAMPAAARWPVPTSASAIPR